MRLSVQIVTCHRFQLFQRCLKTVLTALPPESEVVVILNGGDTETKRWLLDMGDCRVRWFETELETLAKVRNLAFDKCQGEIIYCLDDDVEVPQHLFYEALHRFSFDSKLCVLGGPNLTPSDSTWAQWLFGAVVTSPFAAPLVRRRYGTGTRSHFEACEQDLIFCNVAFRRSAIPSGVIFQESFVSNEETDFIYRCRKEGRKIYFARDLFVYHQRRSNLRKFLSQIFSYGFGRAQQTVQSWKSCHPLFLVPPLAVFIICLPAAYPESGGAVLSLVALHQLLALWSAFYARDRLETGVFGILLMAPLTGMLHLSYGIGFWAGLLASITRKLLVRRSKPEFQKSKTSRGKLAFPRHQG